MKNSSKIQFDLTPNDVAAIEAAKSRPRKVRVARGEKAGREFRPWNCAFTDCRKPSE
jgi:hypothetical protein